MSEYAKNLAALWQTGYDAGKADLEALRIERDRYKKALEFYAYERNYELREEKCSELTGFTHHIARVMDDSGAIAREALKP